MPTIRSWAIAINDTPNFSYQRNKNKYDSEKKPKYPEVLGFITAHQIPYSSDFCLCFAVVNCAQTLSKWQWPMSRKNYCFICSFLTTKLLTSFLFSFFFYIFPGIGTVSFQHSPYIKPTTQLLSANLTSKESLQLLSCDLTVAPVASS